MAEEDPGCQRCKEKLAFLRGEVTSKNLELLEARNVAMSSVAQLRTRIAKQNASIAIANSTIRKFKASQVENKDNTAAATSGPKTLVPENVMALRLRRRVKAAIVEIRTLKKDLAVHKSVAKKNHDMNVQYKEQLARARARVDELEEKAVASERTNNHVARQMLLKVDNVEIESKRLKQLVVKRGSDVVQMEDRLGQTLRLLKEQQEKYKVALEKIHELQKSRETVTSLKKDLESSNSQLMQYKLKSEHQKRRIMRAIELQKSSFSRLTTLQQEEIRAQNLAESLRASEGIIEGLEKNTNSLENELQLKDAEACTAIIRLKQVEKELEFKNSQLFEQQRKSEDYFSQIEALQNELSNAMGNNNLSRTIRESPKGASDGNTYQVHRISSLEKQLMQLSSKVKRFRTKCEALTIDNRKLVEYQKHPQANQTETAFMKILDRENLSSELKHTVTLLANVKDFFSKALSELPFNLQNTSNERIDKTSPEGLVLMLSELNRAVKHLFEQVVHLYASRTDSICTTQ